MRQKESAAERLAAPLVGLYLTALFLKDMVNILKSPGEPRNPAALYVPPLVKNASGTPEGYLDPAQVTPSFTDEELYRWVSG